MFEDQYEILSVEVDINYMVGDMQTIEYVSRKISKENTKNVKLF